MAVADIKKISKVTEYERFLNDVLREDLKKILQEQDKICTQLSEYLQLRSAIDRIQEDHLSQSSLKTKVDIGCNFYVQSVVTDPSHIFVHIGFGFYLEYTLKEALNFIKQKVTQLDSELGRISKDSAKVKAHIKFILEALREVQNLDVLENETAPHRDVWSE